MGSSSPKKHGDIIRHLVKSGRLSSQKLTHAERVNAKLLTPKPLLHTLKELNLITDDMVNEVIREAGVSIRIGELLVELGHINEDNLNFVFNAQKDREKGLKFGQILEKYNFVSSRLFADVLSMQLGLPTCEPTMAMVDKKALEKIPLRMVNELQVLPLQGEDNSSLIAIGDPLDEKIKSKARRFFGQDCQFGIANIDLLQETIKLLVDGKSGKGVDLNTKTVVGIVNYIIVNALKEDASDIHIEPMSDRLLVRFREDGVLRIFKTYAIDIATALTSRLKILAEADIAEKRRHQGGRILFESEEGPIDIRVSFYVTIHGEKTVLRILKQKQSLLELQNIGMMPNVLRTFLNDVLYQPTGVLLVTGPTGSGKTSTIYSCLNHIKSPETSIITAEEPVEYVMDGISQCSIDPQINLTFEETLRHIVRQDPDVIVIGEIRDIDSAEMAMQSALTGHKVLSTFHTEDSIGGLIRLLNMDVAPFLISSTVVSVVAQRLLRRVCVHCAEPAPISPDELARLGLRPDEVKGANFVKGRGCAECKQSGYKGRVGIFELLVLNEAVRAAILAHNTSHEIRTISIETSGLMTLLEDGLIKAADGITSVSEMLRCLPRLNKPRPLGELRRLAGG